MSEEAVTQSDETKPSWFNELPEDLRNDPSVSKFSKGTPATMAKSYKELSSMLGKRELTLPDENSTEEQRNDFFRTLGRPDTYEGYELSTERSVPEPIKNLVSPEGQKAFREQAHSLNLSKAQADKLYKWYVDKNVDHFETVTSAQKAASDEAFSEMKKEYGTNYDANITLAKEVASKIAPELADKVGSNPSITKLLIQTGKMMSDDSISFKTVGTGSRSIDVVQGEISTMMNDEKNPMYIRMHPEHLAQVAKFQELNVELDELKKKTA